MADLQQERERVSVMSRQVAAQAALLTSQRFLIDSLNTMSNIKTLTISELEETFAFLNENLKKNIIEKEYDENGNLKKERTETFEKEKLNYQNKENQTITQLKDSLAQQNRVINQASDIILSKNMIISTLDSTNYEKERMIYAFKKKTETKKSLKMFFSIFSIGFLTGIFFQKFFKYLKNKIL
jgi:hypothetical protein